MKNKNIIFPLLALSMSMGLVGCNFNIDSSDLGLFEDNEETAIESVEIEDSKETKEENINEDAKEENKNNENVEDNKVEEEIITNDKEIENEVEVEIEEKEEVVKEEIVFTEETNSIEVEEEKNEISSTPITSVEETTTTSFKEHSFENFAITLNEKEYKFPLKVQTLIEDGFVFEDDDLNTSLESNQYTFTIYAVNANNERIGIRVFNLDSEAKEVKDCNVLAFVCENEKYKYTTPKLDIPWGAKLGETTLEEFDAFYTSPDRKYDSDTGVHSSREFSFDSTSFYSDNSIEYQFSDGILNKVTIEFYD